LRTRTTEDVIADLKRPIGSSLRLQASTEGSSSLSLADKLISSVHNSTRYKGQSEDPVHEFDEEEYGEEDEIGPLTKTKKISERRRRMNAIADQYIQTSLETTIKKDIEKGYEDDELQSTRWIVNKSENREIISSPREYQTELFERAKEKNIIAVLDTGMSPNGVEL
jgi:endoribonuclease Dicer